VPYAVEVSNTRYKYQTSIHIKGKISMLIINIHGVVYSMHLTSWPAWVCAPQGILHLNFSPSSLWHPLLHHQTIGTPEKALKYQLNTRMRSANYIFTEKSRFARCRFDTGTQSPENLSDIQLVATYISENA